MKHPALLFAVLLGLESTSASDIESGAYTLKMTDPKLVEKDIVLSGSLKVADKRFTFEAVDIGGDPITFQGKITEKGILIWVSQDERDHLVTFHLTGVLAKSKESLASGKVSVFQDHETVGVGEWQLQKTSEQIAAGQPATRPLSK